MTQPLDRTLLNQHVHRYRKQMTQQHKQAVALLTQEAPDYSSAAAACHRALQFQRQAGALTALANDPERPQSATGLHAALTQLLDTFTNPVYPSISADALRALLEEHPA